MPLFLLFLIVPLIEIALFIQVGGLIALWPTLAIVVLTAIVGTYLVRSQGLAALAQLSRSFDELRDPTEPLAHGAMILFSGALLLTPGFFTDAVGFLLLVPSFREWVMQKARKRFVTMSVHSRHSNQHPSEPDVVEGEYYEIKTEDTKVPGNSGWTRH